MIIALIGSGTNAQQPHDAANGDGQLGEVASGAPATSSTARQSDPPLTSSSSATQAVVTTGPGFGTQLCGSEADDKVASRNLVGWHSNVGINGKTFVCAYVAGYQIEDFSHVSQANIDLNLGRQYATIKARIGITDKSYADQQVQVQAFADGNSIYDRTFVLGQSDDVTLNITGVLRLSFVFAGQLTKANAAIGDPLAFT